jgi:hypothetical protein
MSHALLLAMAVIAAEPPRWYEVVHLHKPLLPDTTTRLVATDDFLSTATRLAEKAETHLTSDSFQDADCGKPNRNR